MSFTPSPTLPGVLLAGTHAQRPSTSVPAGTIYGCSTHGVIYQWDGATWNGYMSGAGVQGGVSFMIDDKTGVAPVAGNRAGIEIPFACTIVAVRMFASASGSIVVDLNKASYSGLPTATSICASAKPTLSSSQKMEDTTLTGWTTAINAGDWIIPEVEGSPSGLVSVTLSLTLVRT